MSKSKEFFTLQAVQTALERLFAEIDMSGKREIIPTIESIGRVVAGAVQSPVDLPAFSRSAMDGYAVRASDTFGASDALPAYLTITGHVNMGEVPEFTLKQGEAAVIHTGAMIPDGADAVVMIEHTQQVSDDEIEVLAPVANGENIIKHGEDVAKNSEALSAGHVIRPQDIGGLLAAGITKIDVIQRLKISILSSGDELIEAHQVPELGQIRDINSHMLAALCQQTGAEVLRLDIAKDNLDSMLSMAQEGFENSDMLILSAGSSVSVRDLTGEVINQLGKPGILQHGLAVKPGKPTIIAACDGKPVIGLPGNPVSAMLVARQVVLPVIHYLTGQKIVPVATVSATLSENIASTSGREDTVPIRLHQTEDGYHAEPIRGKSNLIYTLLQANALLHIPLNISGYTAGTSVEVVIF